MALDEIISSFKNVVMKCETKQIDNINIVTFSI
jgi:hypothetical protein